MNRVSITKSRWTETVIEIKSICYVTFLAMMNDCLWIYIYIFLDSQMHNKLSDQIIASDSVG